MSYNDVADVAEDGGLFRRVSAAAAKEGEEQPQWWAQQNAWHLAASPGWGEAYASARANNVPNPGTNEGVITDGMILSAVQARRALIPSDGG